MTENLPYVMKFRPKESNLLERYSLIVTSSKFRNLFLVRTIENILARLIVAIA